MVWELNSNIDPQNSHGNAKRNLYERTNNDNDQMILQKLKMKLSKDIYHLISEFFMLYIRLITKLFILL
ncbi:hypothetical protein RIR_jg25331.t1 [Rhizophagus irregularis DAOM 181602=DAOM 197198]|nr:hypothetical protein RIR_jg25331.t1 [Rhizophagus irregularis DAOM 181602=DAOM 197198]